MKKSTFLPVVLFFIALSVSLAFIPKSNRQQQSVALYLDSSGTDLVDLKAGFDNQYFYPDSNSNIAYYLELSADEYTPSNLARVPLNIALVIDRSGSMQGDKLKYVKEAVNFVVDNLGANDYLSIVIYDDAVDVLLEPQLVAKKEHIKSLVNKITDRGSTNLSGGMLKGFDLIKGNFKDGYVNRVLLLSDGLANQGITDPTALKHIATNMSAEFGITLSTFGVGLDFNEDLMMDLAEAGRANYHFIASPDEVPSIFSEELSGLLSVVAQNVDLIISIPEGLRPVRVYGYERGNNPLEIRLKLHDLISEETKSMVIEFERTSTANSFTVNAEVSFADAVDLGNVKKLNVSSTIKACNSYNEWLGGTDSAVVAQHVLFKSNYLLSETIKAVDDDRYDDAQEIMRSNQGFLSEHKTYMWKSKDLKSQDSIVNMYDSTMIKNIREEREMDAIYIKSTQKSIKSDNYKARKKGVK